MTSLDASPSIGPQGGTSRLGFAGVQVSIDARDLRRVEAMFAVSPKIVAKHMRDVFGQFAGSFRKTLLAGLPPNYQRLARKSVFYRVRPKQAAQSTAFSVGNLVRGVDALDEIRMRIWATSQVTLLHEIGGTVHARGGRAMAIPVDASGKVRRTRKRGDRATTPAGMRAAGKTLIRRGGALFEVSKTAKGKERLKLTHLLTGAVNIKPALGVIRTWNGLEADRQRRLQIAINRAAAEMARVAAKRTSALVGGLLRAVA